MREGTARRVIWRCCLIALGIIFSGCTNLSFEAESTMNLTATPTDPHAGSVLNIIGTRVPTTSLEPGAPEPKCILDSTICDLPCWEGIAPGETSLEDVLARLNSSNLVEPESIKSWVVELQLTRLEWRTKWSENSRDSLQAIGWPNAILVRSGIVDSIELWTDSHACALTVGEVVDAYGPPIKTVYDPHAGSGEIAWHQLDLLYPSRGLVFGAMTQDPPFRNGHIGIVYCFEPTSLEQLVGQPARYGFQRQLYDESGTNLDDWIERLEEWRGFADVTSMP